MEGGIISMLVAHRSSRAARQLQRADHTLGSLPPQGGSHRLGSNDVEQHAEWAALLDATPDRE